MSKRRSIVFGIFDGVHEGHRSLFQQAREYGDELVVCVGRDAIAEQLKGKTPKYAEEERRRMVEQEPLVDKAVLGDNELSSYKVLEELNPDVICLGYDQSALEKDLRRWLQEKGKDIPIYRLEPYQPGRYHSSRL